jgi:hypothetical protein
VIGIVLYRFYLAAVALHNPNTGCANKVWHIIIGGMTFWHRKALKNNRIFVLESRAPPRQGLLFTGE